MRTLWQRLSEKVSVLSVICSPACSESRSLGVEREVGGNLHLKLNSCLRPIANKYYLREDAEDFVKES